MLVRASDPTALYRQVYRRLRAAILAGRYAPGERLPSSRGAAADNGVSRNVVLLAFDQLRAEGYVEGRHGSGTFDVRDLPEALLRAPAASRAGDSGARTAPPAPPRLSAWARRTLAEHARVPPRPTRPLRYDFRYGRALPDAPPSAAWQRAALREGRRGLLEYGAATGHPPLCDALAAYLARWRGVSCRPEQIVVTNGAQQGLDLAARVLLDPGDVVAIEEPQYAGARAAFAAAGARLAPVPVDAEGLDPSRLPRRARAAYATPSHQFPTGAVLGLSRRLALVEWARRTAAWIVEDDYDSELRYEGRPIESIHALDGGARTLLVGTFSKVLFPALRLGFLVAPPSLVPAFAAAKWNADRHSPVLSQDALARFIASGAFESHLRRLRARAAERRGVLLDALARELGSALEVTGARTGLHLLAWLNDVPPARVPALVEAAREREVGVYPIDHCYLGAPARGGLLFGLAALDPQAIREGVRRFAAAHAAVSRRSRPLCPRR